MTANSFGSRASLKVGGSTYEIFRLDALERRGLPVTRLPYSLKILLENLLRREDGRIVRSDDVEKLSRWGAARRRTGLSSRRRALLRLHRGARGRGPRRHARRHREDGRRSQAG
jgi:aconitase A